MRVSESCSIFLMRKLFNIFEQLQVKSLCSESPGSAASRCAAAGDTTAKGLGTIVGQVSSYLRRTQLNKIMWPDPGGIASGLSDPGNHPGHRIMSSLRNSLSNSPCPMGRAGGRGELLKLLRQAAPRHGRAGLAGPGTESRLEGKCSSCHGK